MQTTISNLIKMVENTVGKGEIARYEQFLLFPLCFQKTYSADINQGLFGKGLKFKERFVMVNPLEDDNILALSELKATADDKCYSTVT